jgi:hypothetical protein
MQDNIIPPSINQPHIVVFENIFTDRLADINISDIMCYMVDICQADKLYYLASQWDVLGPKGWQFATTETQKRDLVRNAVKLNKIIGTPRSIIIALNSLGYPDVVVQEHLEGAIYNGDYTYNGAITYGGGYHWAMFRVLIGSENVLNLTGQQYLDIISVILAWKNERSWLDSLVIGWSPNDPVGINDELEIRVYSSGGIFDDTFDTTFE